MIQILQFLMWKQHYLVAKVTQPSSWIPNFQKDMISLCRGKYEVLEEYQFPLHYFRTTGEWFIVILIIGRKIDFLNRNALQNSSDNHAD